MTCGKKKKVEEESSVGRIEETQGMYQNLWGHTSVYRIQQNLRRWWVWPVILAVSGLHFLGLTLENCTSELF